MASFSRRNPGKSLFHLFIIALSLFTATALLPATRANATILSWTAPTTYTDGTAIISTLGYKVYIGASSGNYTQNVDVGTATSYTLSNLTPGTTYYYAVKAYDSSGDVSGYSTEQSYTTTSTTSTTYTITASAGTGGAISPSGSAQVAQGGTQSFSIVPSSGYTIAGVSVDGASVGAVSSYTFSNVTANHTISATFAANTTTTYTITASAGTGGSISPAGSLSVASGASQSFTLTPASGYSIAGVAVDGISVGAVSSYTFSKVTANHTISASFAASSSTTSGTYTIFAVNSGGPAYAGASGNYLADNMYSGGSVGSTTSTISGTTDGTLYQTERYGNFSYKVPVPNGTYSITLKFTEFYFSSAGQRVFSVAVNGQTVIGNLDIYAKVGKNVAYDVVIPVNVINGVININFISLVNNAKVNAIKITSNSAGTVSFADNGGGPKYVSSTGTTYLADTKYSGGGSASTTSTISGTTEGPVYQTERYGNFSYNIPLTNGNYLVTLKLAEIYWSSPGKRIFSVALNGQTVISNLDIYAVVGKNKALDLVVPVSVTNGALSINFTSQVDYAKISGISVRTM